MNITGSEYEKEMKQIPRQEPSAPSEAPKGIRCHGCVYWKGIMCVTCYREWLERSGR